MLPPMDRWNHQHHYRFSPTPMTGAVVTTLAVQFLTIKFLARRRVTIASPGE